MHVLHHIHDMLTALQPALAMAQAGIGIGNLVLRVWPKRKARKNGQ
jgi:hypothetical protein